MSFFFFFNDTATTEIYTLSLHDALPILISPGIFRHDLRPNDEDAVLLDPDRQLVVGPQVVPEDPRRDQVRVEPTRRRSEEHTSELQSPCNLVCRLLLEKKTTATYPSIVP